MLAKIGLCKVIAYRKIAKVANIVLFGRLRKGCTFEITLTRKLIIS